MGTVGVDCSREKIGPGPGRVLYDGRTLPFAPITFSEIRSNQVLEHVEDLPRVAGEMHRVTQLDGTGHHAFPAWLRPIEPHLFMPFVHWIPKPWRAPLIRWFTWLGIEPGWGTADEYVRYSLERTFYRSPREVRRIFERAGFDVCFTTSWLRRHFWNVGINVSHVP